MAASQVKADQGTVLRNIGSLATCARALPSGNAGEIRSAAVAWIGKTIAWAGPERELPKTMKAWPALDAGGRLVIPGLVDSHTHLAFGGSRADEFEARLRGVRYQDIAAGGGGILSTVRATRDATDDQLLARARAHLAFMVSRGVTTVEAKSGYGLDLGTEIRLLEVYARLNRESPVRVVPTFLGAHAVPPEYAGRKDEYVRVVVEEMLPEVARRRLARFVDVFVEEGAFTPAHARTVLAAGTKVGLRGKLHVDQLGPGGGAELAAELGAISADHLEHISPAGIDALARGGVVAVSLPVASLTLSQPPLPARALLDRGVPVAVATDFNPGSAPVPDLPMALYLACVFQRMTPAESLRGGTIEGARALGLEDEVGSVEVGKRANLVVIEAEGVCDWLYLFRNGPAHRTIVGGTTVERPTGDRS